MKEFKDYIIRQYEERIAELEKELGKYKKTRRDNIPKSVESRFSDEHKKQAVNYLNLGIKHMCFPTVAIKRKKRGSPEHVDTKCCISNQDMTAEQYELYIKIFNEVADVLVKYEDK